MKLPIKQKNDSNEIAENDNNNNNNNNENNS